MGCVAGGRGGRPGRLAILGALGWQSLAKPDPVSWSVPLKPLYPAVPSGPGGHGGGVPAPSGDAPRPVCELLQSWGAGGQQREGGAGASPCTLRPGSRAPGFPALRRSPRVPPTLLPRALTSAAGCPGLLALAGKVDCLGRLLLHLGWVSGPGGSRRVLNFSLTLTVE